jgi:4-amino-4-deoxy-L-arabinose transferase-like glycosyltransferase
MYHNERALKKLRAMVQNNAKVEGCIAEEFKLKEITYFNSVYFVKHRNVNAPTFWYHVNEHIPCSGLQIFQWTGVTVGASTAYQPTEEEQMSALLYMYANMDEMDQYFA